jgi:hypothetical protein
MIAMVKIETWFESFIDVVLCEMRRQAEYYFVSIHATQEI